MTGEITNRQILAMANEGLNADLIAADLGLAIEQVKLVLSAHRAGTEVDRDINDTQLAALRRNAYNLALGSDDDSVQARMTMFLIERDRPKDHAENQSEITAINNAIIIGRAAYEEMMEQYEGNKT